ncbi:MAG: undecaprenyl-diphosphatase UppP [bacterium]
MTNILQSIVIGATQGITEFLPISSSGHLIALPYIFRWPEHSLAYDVALHFGTAIALLAFFWRDWLRIIQGAFSKDTTKATSKYPRNLLWQILVASIPAMIVGLILDKYVENYFHSPILLAANFAIFGICLWAADKYSSQDQKLENMGYKKSILIGLAQCLALIPGVSRSGITMVAARTQGLNREESARFSFLLGTPAMVGAFVFKFKDISGGDLSISFWIGVATSAIFGFVFIKFLLDYLKKGSFSVFAWYRLIFAAILLAVYLLKN